MTEHTFKLTVASVGETFFDGEVRSATIPGSSGEMTILPHHAPLVSTLREGVLTVRPSEGETQTFNVRSGILEVSGNRAVVLL